MALRTGLKALFPLTANNLPYTDLEGSGYQIINSGMSFVSGAPGPCWQAGTNSMLAVNGVTHTYPFAFGVWWKHNGSMPNGSDVMSLFVGSPTDYFEITAYGGGSGHFGRARKAGNIQDADATNWSSSNWNLSVFIAVSTTERYLWQNGVMSAASTTSVDPSGSLNRLAIGALRADSDGGFAPSGMYFKYGAVWEGSTPTDADLDSWYANDAAILPSTAPVLTSPTATVNGTTTATVGATVPIATGTLRAVITNSGTVPSNTQVIAGQDHTGSTSGVLSGSLAISSSGVKTFNISGLTSGTTRHVYLALEDTGGNSAVVYGGVIYPGTWRVASDVTTTGWVITGAATHAAAINEDTAGDAAFTTSPALTGTPSSLTLQLDESRPAGTYTERIRVNVSSGTGFARVVALNDAGTVQGQTADQAIDSTLTTYTLTLTQAGTATRLRLDVWI